MSILLAIYVFVAITPQMQLLSLDAGLWVGIALCLALVVRTSLRSPLVTTCAAGTAATLVSLALVAP